MTHHFPVVDSVLHPKLLGERVVKEFSLPPLESCVYFARGVNDTYLLRVEGAQYILRAYRHGWRTEGDIVFELAYLLHLHNNGAPVSFPLPTRDGAMYTSVRAPEGKRHIAVFSFARGISPGEALSAEHAARLGAAIAQCHVCADTYSPSVSREPLTFTQIAEKTEKRLKPYFVEIAEDWDFIAALCDHLKQTEQLWPRSGPNWGFCNNDVSGRNVHFEGSNRLTLFDFDQCALGWRAFEIAKFFLYCRNAQIPLNVQERFLHSYHCVRPIEDWERSVIPLCMIAAVLFIITINVTLDNISTHSTLTPRYFSRRLEIIREIAANAALDW